MPPQVQATSRKQQGMKMRKWRGTGLLRCVYMRLSPSLFDTHGLQQAEGYASDNLDDPEEDEPVAKKRKPSKAAQKAEKEKEKAKAKAKKKTKKGDDDDYEDEEEDPYSALSKMWKGDLPKPPVGNFENCARCEKQFTVVSALKVPSASPHPSRPHLRRSIRWLRILHQAGSAMCVPSLPAQTRSRSPPPRGSGKLQATSGTS